jgi:hypothetical protein
MNLLNDLIQALLIPLATREVYLFGEAVALSVTPMLLLLLVATLDQAIRWGTRRARRNRAQSREDQWHEAAASVIPAES